MHHLQKLTQLQILLPLVFALVGGATSFLATWQIGGVVETKGQEQTQMRLNQLSAMAADLIQQRTQLEMRAAGISDVPDGALVSRQSNAAMQSFPGQIVLIQAESAQTLYSSLSDSALDKISDSLLNNRQDKTSSLMLEGVTYIVTKKDIVFSPNYIAHGFFMMREGLLKQPYNSIIFRVKLLNILGVLLLAGLGAFLGRWMAMKLRAMTQVVNEAEQGEKPEPLDESGAKELKDLVRALNRLIQGPSAKDKVRQEANTDVLTSLLNRRGLVQAIDEKFSKGGHAAEMSAIFLDLDGFKPINDTYGHDVGDDILCEVAKRLQHCTREEDIVCRLGGDEFVLLFPGLKDRKVLEDRADRVLAKLNEPYWIEDKRVTMGASLGISIGPDDGKTGEELINAADEAMYAAKKTGKNQFTFYS